MPDVHPLRVLLLAFTGWISRRQTEVIDYLVEENLVLKEQMKGRALRLNDDQRRRLPAWDARENCSLTRDVDPGSGSRVVAGLPRVVPRSGGAPTPGCP